MTCDFLRSVVRVIQQELRLDATKVKETYSKPVANLLASKLTCLS